jgi:branched-subunit amino acid transport protein
MTVLLAVLVVGTGSLVFRLAPLLGAHRLPDRLARVAGWAGLAVLAAITVRAVALHRDAAFSGAPVLAAIAVGTGLTLAYLGRSVLVSVSSGAATYLVLAAVITAM